jgi:FtsP/CotA-like multicopper oxidase with cupredoxin domain
MQTLGRTLFRSGGLLLVVAALMIVSALAASAAPARAPAHAPAAATLPAATCGLVGSTRTCNLYAKTGTLTLPAGSVPASVPIWGYSDTAGGAATLPGPTLIVNQGEAVNIILTNVNLPSATSLGFPGQARIPDTTGVTAGNSATYSFSATALQPGTYLYEAGPTANGPAQVAMGLIGALIVRPSGGPGTAYGSAASAYNDEALLVLSEVDPAFNAAPATFNLKYFAPKYWLINGKAYPTTDPIAVGAAGNTLLLRYVNAGLHQHSMGLLGLRQTVLATDGKPYLFTYRAVAETVPAGATLDTITTVPAAAPAGMQYPLYEAANHLDNNGARTGGTINFGGMLTFVTVAGSASCTPDTVGPLTSAVSATPNPTNGTVAVSLSANISDVASCGSNVDAAEYFIDTVGANGTGIPMGGTFGSPTASVNATLSVAFLGTLSSGNHTLYVHGHDAAGNWGPVASTVLNLDKLGPTTNSLLLTPNPTNGTVNVNLDATGSDVGRGGANVDAAEYFIDTCPAVTTRGAAMTQNTPIPPATATTVHFVASIPAGTVLALSEGAHVVNVRSHDAVPGTPAGNWGPCATITLNVDKTAPNTTGVLAEPNPTNGTIGVLVGDFLQEKLSATVSDPVAGGINSNIKAAEGFIDCMPPTPPPPNPGCLNGTGIVFIPNDAVFNSPTEAVYAAFQLFGVQQLTQGRHTVYVHAQDAAGNWGAAASGFLDVDKTGPTVTSASATPNPTLGATSITLSASATDPPTGGTPLAAPASNIVAAEWFDGADPGAGLGNAVTGSFGSSTVSNLSATINVSTWSLGTHNISIRAKDVAGNWGPVTVVLLNVLPSDTIFADGFEAGNLSAWNGGVTGTGLSVTGAGAMVGTQAMQVAITSNASRYVQDNSPVATDTGYRARFYFNPNGTTTATGQQHDIFVALNSSNLTVFRIQYQRSSSSGNAAQVRAVVSRNGGTTTGAWFTINTNAANVIEVAWLAGTSTTFTLYTNGTAHPITNLNTNNSTFRIDTVRLGPQVGPNAVGGAVPPSGTTLAGVSGTEYFDAFVSRRNNTLIGP